MAFDVLTGVVRVSYLNLSAPRLRDDAQTPKYSTALLIPKDDQATYNALNKALQDCYNFAVKAKWNGRRPTLTSPIHDGDGVKPRSGENYGPEAHNHWVLNVSSIRQPTVVGPDKAMWTAEQIADVKSGDYVRIALNAYAYARADASGVTFGWNGLMYIREGESLGGSRPALDTMFPDAWDGDSALPTASWTAAPSAPVSAPAASPFAPAPQTAPPVQPFAQPVAPPQPQFAPQTAPAPFAQQPQQPQYPNMLD